MELKYQKEINNYETDFSNFCERDVLSYRWVFEDINDVRNFIPVYISNPQREEEHKQSNSHTYRGYAISLYSSQQLAKNRLLEITKGKKFLFKRLGNHIAEGKIEMTAGICDEPNKLGHFDLFEYKDVELNGKFTIVEKLS